MGLIAEKKKARAFKAMRRFVVAIFLLLISVVSFYLYAKVFVIPDSFREGQRGTYEIDIKLYNVLSTVDSDGRAWYLPIEKKEQELNLRREDAERFYESIGPTEVIKRGIGSNMRPVGKYRSYLNMLEEIGKERGWLEYEKRKAAEARGGSVKHPEVEVLWVQRVLQKKENDKHEQLKSEYFNSQEGSKTRFYNNFFFMLGYIFTLLFVMFPVYCEKIIK
ncbi:MAG: hypothetical protein KKD07_06195 [Candidatus Omnitrophica bacterium]|nr:hypothetical protein [Candidatus Omnitrophota bacterium]MBU4334014.1 hypothetical protein [Candidatus Omnitrophota bacterium]